MSARLLAAWALLAAAAGCGDDAADVAGEYTIQITNRENGCAFDSWTAGQTATVTLTITQDGQAVTALVGGLTAAYLDVVLGSHTFTGTVHGSHLELALYGTRQATDRTCTWTVNATVDATLDGDYLKGTINYTDATNGSPDCDAREGCRTYQDFNGTRPPR